MELHDRAGNRSHGKEADLRCSGSASCCSDARHARSQLTRHLSADNLHMKVPIARACDKKSCDKGQWDAMKINPKKAISHFFPNPCYEQIYFEAVANSIDAAATKIEIRIEIESFERPDTLMVTISDNGVGFSDDNFRKFSSLLEVESLDHKGLGRLVFLEYFHQVDVVSHFGGSKQRSFRFDQDFDGDSQVAIAENEPSGTTLTLSGFAGEKIKTYNYLRPSEIKVALINHFFPRLFGLKKDGQSLEIDIELVAQVPNLDKEFVSDKKSLTLADLPKLTETSIADGEIDLFQSINISYSVSNDISRPRSLTTAICVDGRTVPYELASPDCVPHGYQLLFLFSSDFFKGKTDDARQRLDLPAGVSERALKRLLRGEMNRIISEAVPRVQEENKTICAALDSNYPHLSGYFSEDTVGLIIKDEAVRGAQEKFLADQKAVLECPDLDDETYEKALDVSARVLVEYILYRTRIIAKLKSMDAGNNEGEIHDVIVPRRRTHRRCDIAADIYNCNVWLLDDKYMSYATVLSDQTMRDVIREIAVQGEGDDSRPDITMVFSGDPEGGKPVDVVVVELKKHGVGLAKKEEAISQLRQRARLLLKHYPNQINRIWFYAVTDIDEEFKRSLREDRFVELFSRGTLFYKQQPILLDNDRELFVDLYVMTYEGMIGDAEIRNSTFLNILKDGIRTNSGAVAMV